MDDQAVQVFWPNASAVSGMGREGDFHQWLLAFAPRHPVIGARFPAPPVPGRDDAPSPRSRHTVPCREVHCGAYSREGTPGSAHAQCPNMQAHNVARLAAVTRVRAAADDSTRRRRRQDLPPAHDGAVALMLKTQTRRSDRRDPACPGSHPGPRPENLFKPCPGRALDAVVASALRAAAERRDDELVNLTGPRVYHWQVRVIAHVNSRALAQIGLLLLYTTHSAAQARRLGHHPGRDMTCHAVHPCR